MSAHTDWNQMVSKKMCVIVSKSIGKDWKSLGQMLDVMDDTLNSIEKDQSDVETMAYNMLITWKNSMSEKATVAELTENLHYLDRTDLKEKILQIAQKSAAAETSKNQSASSQENVGGVVFGAGAHVAVEGAKGSVVGAVHGGFKPTFTEHHAPVKTDSHPIYNYGEVKVDGAMGHSKGGVHIRK